MLLRIDVDLETENIGGNPMAIAMMLKTVIQALVGCPSDDIREPIPVSQKPGNTAKTPFLLEVEHEDTHHIWARASIVNRALDQSAQIANPRTEIDLVTGEAKDIGRSMQ